ncbi:YfaZ family outer membrane protein [Enterobacteriaceae bacterium ESL0689]|nr:YfaZ family outer membrane protein [Enterobacteriaceae bacterium ESL0689]
MKKYSLLGVVSAMFYSAAAHAVSVSGEVAQHYTNLGVGFGTESSGLAVSGNWAHSDNDGDAAGVAVGMNIPLGPFLATVGGKGIYTNPKSNNEGYALAAGGGLQWPISDDIRLSGELYYSPDSLSSGIDSYQEAWAGGSWTVIPPVSIRAGYRYLTLQGKDGHKDNTIADGAYLGVSAHF